MRHHTLCQTLAIAGLSVVAVASSKAALTDGFTQISPGYTVQHPYDLQLSDRFSIVNGVYTCWVYDTDKPFSTGTTTGPRTEMRWDTWADQDTGNQFEADALFDAGTSHTCIHQIKSNTAGEAIYLQVNEPGTLRNGTGTDFASGMAGTWFHINSMFNPAGGLKRLYLNGSLKVSGTGGSSARDWYFKNGVYDNGMPSDARALSQWKNFKHWVQHFDGTYQLQNVASGLVLNNQGSLNNGTAVTQWSGANTSSNLKWTFIATDSGYYQINNVTSGKDAVVQSASTAAGAGIVQWSFGSAQNDQWKPTMNTDGTYTFVNRHSGLVLADPGSSTSTSTQMDQESSNGGSNQKWKLIKF
jgi:Ricin-type beta-trefoil lectin domain-like